MASPKKKLPVPVIIAGVVVLFGLTLLPGKKDAAPEEESTRTLATVTEAPEPSPDLSLRELPELLVRL